MAKGRSIVTYKNKVRKVTKWHKKIEKTHKSKKVLKPLEFFTDKIKRFNEK